MHIYINYWYIYVYIHTCTYIHIYTYIKIYIYMYVYIYTCKWINILGRCPGANRPCLLNELSPIRKTERNTTVSAAFLFLCCESCEPMIFCVEDSLFHKSGRSLLNWPTDTHKPQFAVCGFGFVWFDDERDEAKQNHSYFQQLVNARVWLQNSSNCSLVHARAQ